MAEEMFTESSFEEIDIQDSIKRAVTEMGFESMTPIQAQAIPVLLSGKDVIGQAQTGTGKTAAFGIPVLERIDPTNKHLQAIILCPTRELAVQAAGELRGFAKFMSDVKMLPVYGGQDIGRQIQGLKGTQIVIGTPGRVMDHMRRHTIKMDHVSMVVLDEADEMLDMGFREDMEFILGAIEQPHQTCLFSATMPQAILNLANQFQKDPELVKITRKELTTNNIKQYYYPIKWEYKNTALLRLLDYYQYKRSVIFCNTKSMVDELAQYLQKAGYVADGLHGDLSQRQRDIVMGKFRSGQLQILIATDIAARGIDVDDVEAVFNYDLPSETEYYVHRIGRTGRAGREGTAHTLCRNRDFRKLHNIEDVCHAKMEERKIPSVDQIALVRQNAALDKVMASLATGTSGELIPIIRTYCAANEITAEAFAAAALRMQLGESKREGDDIDVDMPKRSERVRRDRDGRRSRFGERRDGERREGDREGRRGERREGNRDERRRERFGERREGDRDGRRSRFTDRREGDRDNRRGDRREGNRDEHRRERFGERREGDREARRFSEDRKAWEEGSFRSRQAREEGREERHSDRRKRPLSAEMTQTREDIKRNRARSKNILERVVKDLHMNGEAKPKKKSGKFGQQHKTK